MMVGVMWYDVISVELVERSLAYVPPFSIREIDIGIARYFDMFLIFVLLCNKYANILWKN